MEPLRLPPVPLLPASSSLPQSNHREGRAATPEQSAKKDDGADDRHQARRPPPAPPGKGGEGDSDGILGTRIDVEG